jgi:hypothetical protein
MKKLVEDLLDEPEVADTYQMIVYENPKKTSIEIAVDISEYIRKLDSNVDGLEEIVLFGFSVGGILASHVMREIRELNAEKKIITYDTPFDILQCMRYLSKVKLLPVDTFYYYLVLLMTYKKHMNYESIRPQLQYWYRGVDSAIQMLQNIHNVSREELEYKLRFQLDQASDVNIVHIYCKNDPIASYEENRPSPTSLVLEKPIVGHCTDMIYGKSYLKEVVYALRYRKI